MSKKHVAKAALAPTTVPTPAEPVILSTATRRLIDGIRGDFGVYVENFKVIATDRATLAPRFIKAFDAWQAQTSGTFVAFVRMLDPSVPEDREGYRNHETYQAALYLQRKMAEAARGPKEEVPEGERPASLYDALAALMATLLPAVDPNGTIWAAFVRQMHWTDQQAQRIRDHATKLGAVKLPPRTRHTLDTLSKAA